MTCIREEIRASDILSNEHVLSGDAEWCLLLIPCSSVGGLDHSWTALRHMNFCAAFARYFAEAWSVLRGSCETTKANSMLKPPMVNYKELGCITLTLLTVARSVSISEVSVHTSPHIQHARCSLEGCIRGGLVSKRPHSHTSLMLRSALTISLLLLFQQQRSELKQN